MRPTHPSPADDALAPASRESDPPGDLVEANLRFVHRIAGQYRDLGLPLEDLVNEGSLGLIEAARRFDPARGTRFTTYAVWWIRKSIRQALTRDSANVYVPEYQVNLMRRLRNMSSRLSNTLGREAEREEVSRALGVGITKIDRILQMKRKEVSLDDGVGPGRETPRSHSLVDHSCRDPEGDLIGREARELLRRALLRLTKRERMVIINRFGLGGGPAFSLSGIARRLGLSRERVRQIEVESKKRLRRALKGLEQPASTPRNTAIARFPRTRSTPNRRSASVGLPCLITHSGRAAPRE